MRVHFGPRSEFLATRFYMFLSKNVSFKRIYFKEFVEAVEETIFSRENWHEMKFAFSLIDIDGNGFLHGPDLLTVKENIEETSEYAEEL